MPDICCLNTHINNMSIENEVAVISEVVNDDGIELGRIGKYKVVREYENECSIDEVLKRLIRIHIQTDEICTNKGRSDKEVRYEE